MNHWGGNIPLCLVGPWATRESVTHDAVDCAASEIER